MIYRLILFITLLSGILFISAKELFDHTQKPVNCDFEVVSNRSQASVSWSLIPDTSIETLQLVRTFGNINQTLYSGNGSEGIIQDNLNQPVSGPITYYLTVFRKNGKTVFKKTIYEETVSISNCWNSIKGILRSFS